MTTSDNQTNSDRVRAFVFSGGGARGALQAGAARALVEAGIEPDMLVGTSIGAVNATHLALHGWSPTGPELQLAAAHDIPVHYVELYPGGPIALHEFPRAASLIQVGYERTRDYVRAHPELMRDHTPPVPAPYEAAA